MAGIGIGATGGNYLAAGIEHNEHGEPTVRLAHEALLTRWDRAGAQITIDRRDLETRKLIESQLSRWHTAEEPDKHDLLLRDPDFFGAACVRCCEAGAPRYPRFRCGESSFGNQAINGPASRHLLGG